MVDLIKHDKTASSRDILKTSCIRNTTKNIKKPMTFILYSQ